MKSKYNNRIEQTRVNPIEPRAYSNTDTDEQSAIDTFITLINNNNIKVDIRSRDKYPNSDGTLEIVNNNQVPIGKLEVQIKKIPEGKNKFSCPLSAIGFSETTTLPFILICVDPVLKKAYWKKLSRNIEGFKPGQDTFTIHFDEMTDLIDSSELYIQKWTEITFEYQERIKQFPELQKEISKYTLMDSLSKEDRIYAQKMIDKINTLLDNDFKIVKEIGFPGIWKFGFGYSRSTENYIDYYLYKIAYGEPYPLIVKINGDISENLRNNKNLGLYTRTKVDFSNTEKLGEEFVFKEFKKIIQNKELKISSELIALEIIFDFIDKYSACIGVEPFQVSYQIKEVKYGLNNYLLGLCYAIKAQFKWENPVIVINLDELNFQVQKYNIKPVERSGSKVIFLFNNGSENFLKVSKSIEYLSDINSDEIIRPHLIKDEVRGGWIWSGYNLETDLVNVQKILENLISEYTNFLRSNNLKITGNIFFDESISIIYEYKSSKVILEGEEPSAIYGVSPSLHTYIVNNHDRSLPKIQVYFSHIERVNYSHDDFIVKINKNSYKLISYSTELPDWLFRNTPIEDYMYNRLKEDLKNMYGLDLDFLI